MRRRIAILVGLMFLKIILNLIEANEFQNGSLVKLTGKIDKIERNVSKCNIYVDRFLTEFQGYCKFSQGEKLMIIGSVKRGLINDLTGNIELFNSTIDQIKNDQELVESVPVNYSTLQQWREKMVGVYERYLPVKEASLVAGIVLGDKKGISGNLYEKMVKSGTVHIAVASGFNLMILSGSLMSWLFWFLRRPWASVVGIVVAGMYSLMAGGEPPVMRAWVMVSMLLIGMSIGRRQSSWWALLLTAWVMVMFDMRLLWSASFQLSVMASVGLMIVEPTIVRYFETKESVLIQLFSQLGITTSVATMLTTAPVIWWHFSRLSLMGVLSNILVLPLIPTIMFLGALMIPLGGILSWPVYGLTHFVILIIEWLGS